MIDMPFPLSFIFSLGGPKDFIRWEEACFIGLLMMESHLVSEY